MLWLELIRASGATRYVPVCACEPADNVVAATARAIQALIETPSVHPIVHVETAAVA